MTDLIANSEKAPFGAIRPANKARNIGTVATGVFSTYGPTKGMYVGLGGLLVGTLATSGESEIEMYVGSFQIVPLSFSDLSSKTTAESLVALF